MNETEQQYGKIAEKIKWVRYRFSRRVRELLYGVTTVEEIDRQERKKSFEFFDTFITFLGQNSDSLRVLLLSQRQYKLIDFFIDECVDGRCIEQSSKGIVREYDGRKFITTHFSAEELESPELSRRESWEFEERRKKADVYLAWDVKSSFPKNVDFCGQMGKGSYESTVSFLPFSSEPSAESVADHLGLLRGDGHDYSVAIFNDGKRIDVSISKVKGARRLESVVQYRLLGKIRNEKSVPTFWVYGCNSNRDDRTTVTQENQSSVFSPISQRS